MKSFIIDLDSTLLLSKFITSLCFFNILYYSLFHFFLFLKSNTWTLSVHPPSFSTFVKCNAAINQSYPTSSQLFRGSKQPPQILISLPKQTESTPPPSISHQLVFHTILSIPHYPHLYPRCHHLIYCILSS